MKTAIVYYSEHHGNTRKLLEAIAKQDVDVTLIDITKCGEAALNEYGRIGFASGVYFGKYNEKLLAYAEKNLPGGKDVFFIHTAGAPRENQDAAIRAIADAKGCKHLGTYYCKGFDTFGPFKLIGGISKGHPSDKEIADAIEFYKGL